MPLEYHALSLNAIELQLSDAVADISMLQCSAKLRILFNNAHFVAVYASHTLASTASVEPIFDDEEEVVVIRNGWTPKKKKIAKQMELFMQFISAFLNLVSQET